jgi:hypothetical protein
MTSNQIQLTDNKKFLTSNQTTFDIYSKKKHSSFDQLMKKHAIFDCKELTFNQTNI